MVGLEDKEFGQRVAALISLHGDQEHLFCSWGGWVADTDFRRLEDGPQRPASMV